MIHETIIEHISPEVSVVANAIGWVLNHGEDQPEGTVYDVPIEQARLYIKAAQRAISQLDTYRAAKAKA